MMKKKNLAVAMAAVTVAGTVAPAFALETKDSKEYVVENQNARSIVSKVRDLLEQKSDETKKQDLYTVYTNVKIETAEGANKGKLVVDDTAITIDGNNAAGVKGNKITNATELANILDVASNDANFVAPGTKLEVVIINNGFATVDNKKVTKIIPTYDNVIDLDVDSKKIIAAAGNDIVAPGEADKKDLAKKIDGSAYDVKFDKKTGEIKVDIYRDLTGKKLEDAEKYIKDEGIKGVTLSEETVKEEVKAVAEVKVDGIQDGGTYAVGHTVNLPAGVTAKLNDANYATGTAINDKKAHKMVFTHDGKETTVNFTIADAADADAANHKTILVAKVDAANKDVDVVRAKTTLKVNQGDAKLENVIKFMIDGKKDAIEFANIFQAKNTDKDVLTRMGEITGFETKAAADIESKELAKVKITNSNLENLELAKFFDGMMLTEDGVKLLSSLKTDVTVDGVKTTVTPSVDEKVKEVTKDKEYSLGLQTVKNIYKKDKPAELDKTETHQLTIKSNDKTKLDKLRKMIQSVQDGVVNNGLNGIQHAKALVGDNRFETAVKVSEELYTEKNAANAIVLVEKDAIVDGLAATPLAHMAKAPILFTNTDSVPTKVVTEIKRALNIKGTAVGNLEKKTIYLVGGEARISNAVKDQLAALGVTVKRVAGDTRTETSVRIAEEMKKVATKLGTNINNEAFVVGRDGQADAMSVAGYAAQTKSPIIVADKTKLTKVAADFIDDEMKTADIIGGETVVTDGIKDELAGILEAKNVERVKGARRSETNANVINKYYKGTKFTNVYVAKDGKAKDSDLADSLVAGPLAAAKTAPVVLATTALASEQSETLDLRLSGDESLTQIGGGVARTIMEKIAVKLGLVK